MFAFGAWIHEKFGYTRSEKTKKEKLVKTPISVTAEQIAKLVQLARDYRKATGGTTNKIRT